MSHECHILNCVNFKKNICLYELTKRAPRTCHLDKGLRPLINPLHWPAAYIFGLYSPLLLSVTLGHTVEGSHCKNVSELQLRMGGTLQIPLTCSGPQHAGA